jgi:hypothetical protein
LEKSQREYLLVHTYAICALRKATIFGIVNWPIHENRALLLIKVKRNALENSSVISVIEHGNPEIVGPTWDKSVDDVG